LARNGMRVMWHGEAIIGDFASILLIQKMEQLLPDCLKTATILVG